MEGPVLHTLFTFLAMIYLCNGLPTNTEASREDYNFGILIDAGSSSSKMKIYNWTTSNQMAPSLPTVKLVENHKFKPALSDFTGDTDGLGDYLDGMMKWAVKIIPEEKRKSTPILIMATAGMRFLDEEVTAALMDDVREVLSNASRNPFSPIDKEDVEVLSGEEEAAYGWIAANSLNGFFNDNKPSSESVGVLEMGGGSTQIAFLPDSPIYDGEFHVTLAKKRFSLYVHSYLNFGASAIKRQIAYYLNSQQSDQNPCMLKGDEKSISVGKTEINMKGSGDAGECRDVLREILKPTEGIRCEPKPCVVRDIYQPAITNSTFYATSAFQYSPKALGILKSYDHLNMTALEEELCGYCDLTVDEAVTQGFGNKKFLSSNCMMGNYIMELFSNYGFDVETTQIKAVSSIDKQSIDWALGAMLVKLSEKFSEEKGSYSVVCPNKVKGGSSSTSGSSGNNASLKTLIQKVTTLLSALASKL